MAEALDQGVMLMALGMGTVFGFLGVLVCALTLMSRLLGSDPSDVAAAAEPGPASAGAQLQADGIDDPELISAIVAAVHRYRNDRS